MGKPSNEGTRNERSRQKYANNNDAKIPNRVNGHPTDRNYCARSARGYMGRSYGGFLSKYGSIEEVSSIISRELQETWFCM